MVLGYLQRVTTRYRQIYKKYILIFLKKIMITRNNPLQIAENQTHLREDIW